MPTLRLEIAALRTTVPVCTAEHWGDGRGEAITSLNSQPFADVYFTKGWLFKEEA